MPRTGLEPARLAAHAPETCASTNSATWAIQQTTNLFTLFFVQYVSGKRDSDPRPQPWQGCALPTELFPRKPLNRTRCQGHFSKCDAKVAVYFQTSKYFACFFCSFSVFLQTFDINQRKPFRNSIACIRFLPDGCSICNSNNLSSHTT